MRVDSFRADRRTDVTNLIVAFRSFANAPNTQWSKIIWTLITNIKTNFNTLIHLPAKRLKSSVSNKKSYETV
jgi:hypothetical protein